MAITDPQSGTRIGEVEERIYRISTPVMKLPGGFNFNQDLIADDEPLLFHTGPRKALSFRPRRGRPGDAYTLRRQLRHRKPARDAAGLPRPAGRCRLAPVDNYCPKLVEAMCEIAAPARLNPQIVLLSPGTYNSHRLEVQRCARESEHLK
jgi:hypothetical protein